MTNGSGTTTATYNYDAFGAIKSQTGSGTNNFLFTGEWRDSETGFYFLRARYYDPVVGRFITRDPFTGFRTDPQSLNRYTYAQNNPVRWNDPSGLSPFDPWLDGLQTLFDLAGLIPGLGEPIDLINAAIYLARGDQLNAALSAGAAIPFFGWAGTAGKFVNKAEKIQQLTQEAQKLYPKLANIEHKHHAQPIYLGGDPKGELSKINAAYHQLITNEFRSQWGYGRGLPSAAELKKIMQNVYDKFPLP